MNNLACNEEIAAFIREDGPPVIAQGAGTKAPLCRVDDGISGLDLSGLNGVVEYEPSEYVISARAGTPSRHPQAPTVHGTSLGSRA